MKKILVLLCLSMILSGCSPAIFNLNSFVMPDDLEFIYVVQELDTPEKIGQYIYDNFNFKPNLYNTPSPYDLWKIKEGDCNDIVSFAIFIANYHDYKTYQILFYGDINHAIAVFIENGQYTYISNNKYYPVYYNNIDDIIAIFCDYDFFEIYDYDMKLIKVGK